MFGSVMDFKLFCNPAGFRCRKRFVQGGKGMGKPRSLFFVQLKQYLAAFQNSSAGFCYGLFFEVQPFHRH